MKPKKPINARGSDKVANPKKKRNLDNSDLKPFFGKGPENIWNKDIYTGNSSCSF